MVAGSKFYALGAVSMGALALALSTSVAAQTADGESVISPQAAPGPVSDEAIVVTGTRIVSPELGNPYPVVTVSGETIARSGYVNLTDLLTETPALVSSTTTMRTAGANAMPGQVGVNLLNLRNLGTDRTLVLVNGRRHVASISGSAAVDINTIPTGLVERIDVLTGGVSAIYGADGVSGVVNFVLKRDFEGIELRAQNGISSRGDAGERYAALTAGHNFAGGAGNIAMSYEFRHQSRVRAEQRRSGRSDGFYSFHQNMADFPVDDPNVPDRVPYNDIRYFNSTPQGAVDLNFDGFPEFNGTGLPYNPGRILPRPGGFAQGGNGTPVAGYGGDLDPEVTTHNFNLLASYEFSPALRFFAEGKYVSTKAFTETQPLFDGGSILLADNPYLPASIRSAIVPGLLGAMVGAPPQAGISGVLLFRDHLEFGRRWQRSDRETWRAVAGFDGEISDHARYEISYTYGQTTNDFSYGNVRIADRYFAAIDAVNAGGNIVCRSTLAPTFPNFNMRGRPFTTFTPGANSGCVPLNILGDRVANEAALGFVMADLSNKAKMTQHVISGSISGDFGNWFELPGGPVSYAVGGEYRKEKSRSTIDPLLTSGAILDLGQINPLAGSFDVTEFFGEVQVPVLRDVPGAQSLQFGAAIRISDYSTVGSTTTWNVSGSYAPVRDVNFRGTYSESVRAPNIAELFAPEAGVFASLRDPCDIALLPQGTEFRQANCAAVLTSFGIDPTTYNPSGSGSGSLRLPGVSAGNPDLREEKARTWTAGIVLTPSFVRGLSASFDWYDIELKNAINTANAQELANLCVDQPTLQNSFCGNLVRNPVTGAIATFHLAPANVARFRTSGADIAVNYAFQPDPAWGNFNLRLVAGYLDTLNFIASPGAAETDEVLDTYAPRWTGSFDLAWTKGAYTFNYGITYFSKTRRFGAEEMRAQPDLVAPEYVFFKDRVQHDIQFAADVYDGSATFYAGVQNLFDRGPAFDERSYPVSYRGRFFYFGIKALFGGY